MPKRGIRSHTSILTRRKRYSANKRARELLTSPPDGVQDYEISDVGHTLVDITSYIDFLTDLGKEHLASTNADPLRDGTGLNALLPSQHLTNALYSLPEVAKDVTNVFVKSVENNNLVDFVGRLKGSPTEKEVKVLEQRFGDAAQQCRSSLAKILHCSTRKSQCGASIRSDILRNLISALHDPDSSLSSEVDAGVSLGISQPLRKTGIFPPYTKKRDAEELQLLRLHQLANYTSASEDASIIEDIISKEIRLGRMKPLSLDEANDPSRVYAKMALIKKIGSASSKPKYRIVEDYRRNGLNSRMHAEETVSLPRLRDVQECLRDLLYYTKSVDSRVIDCQARHLMFFSYDIASAFRNLFVCPSDGRCLCVYANGKAYQHVALPFGVKLAPYHWCRFAACVVRLIRKVIQSVFPDTPFINMIYVDDGFMVFPESIYNMCVCLCLLVWRVLDVNLSWEKCIFHETSDQYIGFVFSIAKDELHVSIREGIMSKAREQVVQLLQQRLVTRSSLAKLAGRLIFVTQLAPYLRSFLQPYFASLSVIERISLRTLRLSSNSATFQVSQFWLLILQSSTLRISINIDYGPSSSSIHLIACSDASILGLGGFVSYSSTGCFFSYSVSATTLGPWTQFLRQPGSVCSSDMTLLELLAACATIQASMSLLGPSLRSAQSHPIVLHLFSDNQSAVAALSKLYSRSPVLSSVLRCLARLLFCSSFILDVVYLKGSTNWLADALSRQIPVDVPSTWTQASIDIYFRDLMTTANFVAIE